MVERERGRADSRARRSDAQDGAAREHVVPARAWRPVQAHALGLLPDDQIQDIATPPIPEPSSWSLLFLGISLIVVCRRASRRWWGAIVARWWLLLLGFLIGAFIGYLISLGGKEVWKASATLYLGASYSSVGGVFLQGPQANPSTAGTIAKARTRSGWWPTSRDATGSRWHR